MQRNVKVVRESPVSCDKRVEEKGNTTLLNQGNAVYEERNGTS